MATANRRNKKSNTKRSDAAPEFGLRHVTALLRFIGVYLVFVGVFLTWQEAWRFVEEKHWFDLRTVDVVGAAQVSEEEIVAYSKLVRGTPVFNIDVARVALQIEAHPWVKEARVSRRLPDALVIEVIEYVPVGVVQLDKLYYVDDEGTPFKIAPPEAADHYIIIEGITNSDFEVMDVGRKMVRHALEVIGHYQSHEIANLAPLKAISQHYNGLELSVGALPTRLVLGDGNLQETFDRTAKLWRHLLAQSQTAETIHLDNRKEPERIPVKLKTDAPDTDIPQTN
jgi:cell division protein FtsQ